MIEPIEKGKISASQLMFSVMCFLQGSLFITAFYAGTAKQDSWIIILSGFIVFMLFLWFYLILSKEFPKKNLIEINDLTYGPIIGKIISGLYIWYFLSIAALNLRDFGGFVVSSLLPETPLIAVLVMVIFICIWAVRNGIEVVVRYGMIFFYTWILLFVFINILSFDNIKLDNLLPIFSLSLKDFLHGTHISSTIPFGELIVFLMFLPSVNDAKKINKSFVIGSIIGMIPLLIIIIRDTAIFGSLTAVLTSPSYEALRVINVGDIFSRMEVIFVVIRLILLFFKITILYFAIALAIAQLTSLKSYRSIVSVIGAIIISYSILVFKSPIENAAWGSDTAPIFSGFFEMFLPTLTLIIVKIKKKIKHAKNNNA